MRRPDPLTRLLFCSGFIVSADIRVLGPVLPAIARDYDVSVGAAGLAIGVYALAYAGGQLFYGPLGDRVGPIRVVRVALPLFACGTALCALAPSLPTLLALRLLTGVFAAGIIPTSLAYFGETIADYAARRRAIGLFLSAIISGQVFGQAIGGILAGLVSWQAIFVLLGAIAATVAALVWARPLPTRAATPPGQRARFRTILGRDRALYLVTATEMFIYLGAFAYAGSALIDRHGASYPLTGAMLSLFALGSIAASRTLHRVAGIETDAARFGAGTAVGAVAFALLATVPGAALFGVAVALLGLGVTFAHSTLQTRATEVEATARGTAVALFACAGNAGSALGTFAAGALVDRLGYGALFGAAAAGMLVLACVAGRQLTPR